MYRAPSFFSPSDGGGLFGGHCRFGLSRVHPVHIRGLFQCFSQSVPPPCFFGVVPVPAYEARAAWCRSSSVWVCRL